MIFIIEKHVIITRYLNDIENSKSIILEGFIRQVRILVVGKTCSNKAPRRKRRGIKCAPQAAGFQPAYAPRGEELNPKRLN